MPAVSSTRPARPKWRRDGARNRAAAASAPRMHGARRGEPATGSIAKTNSARSRDRGASNPAPRLRAAAHQFVPRSPRASRRGWQAAEYQRIATRLEDRPLASAPRTSAAISPSRTCRPTGQSALGCAGAREPSHRSCAAPGAVARAARGTARCRGHRPGRRRIARDARGGAKGLGVAVPQLGVMIETPASALAGQLADGGSPLSINSDLSQYTRHRRTGARQRLDALHPAVLRLITRGHAARARQSRAGRWLRCRRAADLIARIHDFASWRSSALKRMVPLDAEKCGPQQRHSERLGRRGARPSACRRGPAENPLEGTPAEIFRSTGVGRALAADRGAAGRGLLLWASRPWTSRRSQPRARRSLQLYPFQSVSRWDWRRRTTARQGS